MSPSSILEDQSKSPDFYRFSTPVSRCVSPFSDEEEGDETCSDQGCSSPNEKSMFLNFTSDLNPQNSIKKQKNKKSTTYKVNGVNILNRKSLDSKTVMERLKRRRENHNHVERKRRDNINLTILEISQLIPQEPSSNTKLNKGNILRMAVDYIKELQYENLHLKSQSRRYRNGKAIYSSLEASSTMNEAAPISSDALNTSSHNGQVPSEYRTPEMTKVETKNYYTPIPTPYPTSSAHLTAVNDRYSYVNHQYPGTSPSHQRLHQPQASATLPTTSLPLPSIMQLPGHTSAALSHSGQYSIYSHSPLPAAPRSSRNSLYHSMQHRGLMLTDYHNTLNLF